MPWRSVGMFKALFKQYNPDQPRDPKGTPTGGQFVSVESAAEDYEDYGMASTVNAISEGKDPGTIDINGNPITDDYLSRAKLSERALQHAAATTRTKHKTLWRGMLLEKGTDVFAMFPKGKVYTLPRLTSSSHDVSVAEKYLDLDQFSGGMEVEKVLIRFSSQDGVRGYDSKAFPETIMPKGQEFRSYGIKRQGDKWVVDLYASRAQLEKPLQKGWDESKHSRHPKGHEDGGKFSSKDEVSRALAESEAALREFVVSERSLKGRAERGIWIDGDTGEVYADVTGADAPDRLADHPGVGPADTPRYRDILQANNIIAMHTHPEPTGFSDGDFGLFAYHNERQKIVIDSEGTRWHLEKTPEFDTIPPHLREPRHLKAAWNRHMDEMIEAGEYARLKAPGLISEAARRTADEYKLRLTVTRAVTKASGEEPPPDKYKSWDESKHPRHPAGGEKGGQFKVSAANALGYSDGQLDAQIVARDGDRVIGTLDFDQWRGELRVKMVEVLPEFRRRGVATAMYEQMLTEFPDSTYTPSMRTTEGGGLIEALSRRFPGRISKAWDEADHPRDEDGKFTWAEKGTHPNPIGNQERLIGVEDDSGNQTWGGFKLQGADTDDVYLQEVRAVTRGGGRVAMQFLTDRADKYGKTLTLEAVPLEAGAGIKMTPERLRSWYAQFGFVRDAVGGDTMVRKPKRRLKLGSIVREVSVTKDWNESDHPRHPEGSNMGGKFAPKGGSGSLANPGIIADEHGLQLFDNTENLREVMMEMEEFEGTEDFFMEAGYMYSGDLPMAEMGDDDNALVSYRWSEDLEGERTAHIDEIVVSDELQGKGIGAQLIKYMSDRAQAEGMTGLTLMANMSAGGYAWARMGFAPETPFNMGRVAEMMEDRLSTLDTPDRLRIRTMLKDMKNKNLAFEVRRRTFWNIVDSGPAIARPLLTNQAYAAGLSFADKEAMARFNQYVNRGKK